MMESSLCIYKGKIQEAINLVPCMDAEYKLKAVQYWNAVSEHLQEIVNKSASDFNSMDANAEARHDVDDRSSEQQQVITPNQPQAASPSSLETQVYNIVSSNNNSSISRGTNDLFYNEFLTGDTSECGSGITSPSDQAQQLPSKKEDLSDDNQTNNNMPSSSDAINTHDDSLLQMIEQDQATTIKDSSSAESSTNLSTFATTSTGSIVNISQTTSANQTASNNSQQAVIVTTEDNLLATTLATSRTSPLNAYMIDTSTIIPSRVPAITSGRILIGQSDSTPVSSPVDGTNRIDTVSSAQTINDINTIQQNSMITVDSRTYVSNSNHITSGVSSTVRPQAIHQAHPPLIPPVITNVATPIMQSHSVVPSHCSPIQTYHTSAIQHQLQPLNGYDHHMAVQHSRPLHQHQLINFEMVGLNPEYNYIQTFPCDTCGKQFNSSGELSQHRVLHITDSNDDGDVNRQHETDTLNLVTNSSANNNATNMSTVGSNQHTCNICGKSGFSTKGNLKRHLRAHSGEKPFKCEYCDSRFTEKKSLKIHLRRHTGEKPYKCDICGKLFSQTGVLQSHMALHLNERKFGCNLCGKAFRQRSQLKLHIMRHEGVKRLECSTCSAKFLTKGDLERHYRIHTGERPYECKICKKTFTRQQSLNEHLNRHYGTKPYSCPSCDKTFSEMSACYKHAKIHKKQDASL